VFWQVLYLWCLTRTFLDLELLIFGTVLQIQEPFGPAPKLSLVSCTRYTLPKVGDCIGKMSFYNKLELGISIFFCDEFSLFGEFFFNIIIF
jgi:hypothetical protein